MQSVHSNTTVSVARVAGQDALARLMDWATPVAKVNMGNLDFAMAQRRVASDETASGMLSQLLADMARANALQEKSKARVRAIHSYRAWARNDAEAIHDARKIMQRLLNEKSELRRETLAYARQVKQLKATSHGGRHDELARQVTQTKQELDRKRDAHKAAMATATVQLDSAEEQLQLCYNEAAVMEIIELLQAAESYYEQARSIRQQLEDDLNAFEEYVARLG